MGFKVGLTLTSLSRKTRPNWSGIEGARDIDIISIVYIEICMKTIRFYRTNYIQLKVSTSKGFLLILISLMLLLQIIN